MADRIMPLEATSEHLMLVDALIALATEECGDVFDVAEILVSAAATILVLNFAPRSAIALLDTIVEGGRQAVREAMN